MQVQVLSSALIIMPDYSGFFLLYPSITTLVPGNGTQNVYFVCMPINSKPQVSLRLFHTYSLNSKHTVLESLKSPLNSRFTSRLPSSFSWTFKKTPPEPNGSPGGIVILLRYQL